MGSEEGLKDGGRGGGLIEHAGEKKEGKIGFRVSDGEEESCAGGEELWRSCSGPQL